MCKTAYKILDVKEFDDEFQTLTAKAIKIHLFEWVYLNLQKGIFINQDQVKELLIAWQQNIIEHDKTNEHKGQNN